MDQIPQASPALPPKIIWKWHWDLVKTVSLKADQQEQTTELGAQLGIKTFCTWNSKPAQPTCVFFLPLWHSSHRATWHLSANMFQVFSSHDSFLANFLGQMGHYLERLFYLGVCICCLSGWEIFAIVRLSHPLTLCAECRPLIAFWSGGYVSGFDLQAAYCAGWVIFAMITTLFGVATTRTSCLHPVRLVCLRLALDSFLFN